MKESRNLEMCNFPIQRIQRLYSGMTVYTSMSGCGDVSPRTQTVDYLYLRSERVSNAVACRSLGNRVPKLLRPLRFTYLYIVPLRGENSIPYHPYTSM